MDIMRWHISLTMVITVIPLKNMPPEVELVSELGTINAYKGDNGLGHQKWKYQYTDLKFASEKV